MKNKFIKITLLSAVVFCSVSTIYASKYHAKKGVQWFSRGGYSEVEAPNDLLLVGYEAPYFGNDSQTVAELFKLRCADLARQRHKKYFLIYKSLPDAINNMESDLPTSYKLFSLYESDGYIRFTNKDELGAFDANKLYAKLSKKYKVNHK